MADEPLQITEELPEVEILPEDGDPPREGARPAAAQSQEVDGVAALKANLEAETRRREQAERRTGEIEAARRADAVRAAAGSIDGQIATITEAKRASEQRMENLSAQRTAALSAGDYAKEAQLSRQMMAEQAKITQYDGGLYALDQQKRTVPQQRQPEQPQRQPEQRQEPQGRTENFIRANNLAPPVAKFIRDNPGFVATDRSIRRLADADEDARAAGHADQSEGYFDFVRNAMAPRQAQEPHARTAEPQRRPQIAAPPSRSAAGAGGGGVRKLTLTAAEARNAREIGLSTPAELASYARELDRMKRGEMH